MNFLSYLLTFFFISTSIIQSPGDSSSHKRFDIPDDDVGDSPDIEIDDSLSFDSTELDDYKKEPANANEETDSNEDNSDVLTGVKLPKSDQSDEFKRSNACAASDDDDTCKCRRSCFPVAPRSFQPCSCDTNNEITALESPPLLASQPSIPSFGSNFMQTNDAMNCFNEISNPYCTCQKACVPGMPVNYDPCTCMGFDSYPQKASYDFDPSAFGSSTGYTNSLAPQPSYYGDESHVDENSCGRACLPYTVQQQKPCMCNFNLMNDQTHSLYSPSMLPTAYDAYSGNSFQDISQNRQSVQSNYLNSQYQQQTTPGPFINSHIPKVSRPESSVGAYLGCYRDKKKSGRDLKMGLAVPKLTPDSCINKCREHKKRFAAVQNGYLCFCGSRFGRYNRTKDMMCGVPCTGDPQKYCGGHWLNAVYSTDGQLYNPKQFSFKTKDPKDELDYDRKLRAQYHSSKHASSKESKNQKQKEKNEISSDREFSKKTKKSKDHKSEKQDFSQKSSISHNTHKANEDKKPYSKSKPHSSSRKTILETAESPSDMAQMLALGKNKSKASIENNPSKASSIENTSLKRSKKRQKTKLIIHV